jgi:hypothetical protein
MTTFMAWVAVDDRLPSAIYLASDSRITWGTQRIRWDSGRKLFACAKHPDLFGYVGDVVFPSLVLGQIVEAADRGLLFDVGAGPNKKHVAFVQAVKNSFTARQSAPTLDFSIVHITGSLEAAITFHAWELSYNASASTWTDSPPIPMPQKKSELLLPLGSGAKPLKARYNHVKSRLQGDTSRAVFWAFCDALAAGDDPLTGGAPQLVGLYSNLKAKSFGIVFQGRRYFLGMPLPGSPEDSEIEWRDEKFQRINGATLELIDGAQRHGR